MKKKLLSILLVLCMVLGTMPVAFADDIPSLDVGGSSGTTADTGLPTADENGVITLGTDTYTLKTGIEADVVVPKGVTATLDLNGHNIEVLHDCGIGVKGTLTVKDSSTSTDGSPTTMGRIFCKATPVAVEGTGATFALDSGNVVSQEDYGIYALEGGKAIINGGSVVAQNAAFSGNNTTGNMEFEVHGGTLTTEWGPAIYMPGQVNLTITGGVLNGGVSLRMGQVNISGGTINSITKNIDLPASVVDSKGTLGYDYSGNVWFPDALYVINGTYTSKDETYGNSLNLNITGGTFNCLNDQGCAVAIYDEGRVAQNSKVSISGNAVLNTKSTTRSSFDVLSLKDVGVENPKDGYNNPDYVGKVESTITGGTFSSDPKPAYLPTGYGSYVTEDQKYTVKAIDYNVFVDSNVLNGTVEVDPETAHYGAEVHVTYEAAQGYVLEALTAKTEKGEEVKIENGRFTMPAEDVTVTASFKKDVNADEKITVTDKKTEATVAEDAKVSDTDKEKLAEVADKAAVAGVAASADEKKILEAAKVTDTTDKNVEIEITTKVETKEADLTNGTLTFAVTPVATVTVDGTKVTENPVAVTNDMLDSTKKITVKLPLPANFKPEEIIHVGDNFKQLYKKGDFKVEDGVAILEVTHFSDFIMNGKAHEHTWDEGKVTKDPTDTEKGEKLYTCTTCGDTKTEEIPVIESKGLKLDAEKVSLVLDGNKTLKLTIDPDTATGTPVWKSSNEKVVKVENGKLTATGTGVATVTVTLGGKTATCTVTVTCGEKKCEHYTDVKADEWYHAAVDYVTENGIMQGMGGKIYAPDEKLTRAELAQILFNLESDPKNGKTKLTFTDVEKDDWFAEAVAWAASNDIVNGFEESDKTHTFRPNQAVTRQDMVTMIARYAKFKDIAQTTGDGWKEFKDYEQVGDWATEAMAWAVEDGLVNGMGNDKLEPTGTAARSQIAQIMMKFNSKYAVK